MTRALPVVFEDTIQPNICAPCGGACCKNMPGTTAPEYWGAPDRDEMLSRLTEALRTGRWAIDWWEGDPRPKPAFEQEKDEDEDFVYIRGFYVRPATVGKEGYTFDSSWGGRCTFHTDSGCSHEPENRPEGCLALTPGAGGKGCYYPDNRENKQGHAIRWFPYHDVIRQAADAAGEA